VQNVSSAKELVDIVAEQLKKETPSQPKGAEWEFTSIADVSIFNYAFNHKRVTAAKFCVTPPQIGCNYCCAVPFCDGVTHGILQRWCAYD
jgi:hypothetical protein